MTLPILPMKAQDPRPAFLTTVGIISVVYFHNSSSSVSKSKHFHLVHHGEGGRDEKPPSLRQDLFPELRAEDRSQEETQSTNYHAQRHRDNPTKVEKTEN